MRSHVRWMLFSQLCLLALLVGTSNPPTAIAAPAPLTVELPAEGSTVTDSNVTFEITSPDADDIQCKFDDDEYWDYCWFGEKRGFTNGPHTAYFRSVVYGSGTEYGSTVSRSFTVADSTPPAVVLSQPADGATLANSRVPIAFTVDDVSGRYLDCVVDGVEQWCEDGYTKFDLDNGPHTLTISGNDPAGNVGTATSNFFVADTTPPEVVITSPTDGSTVVDRAGLRLRFTVDGRSAEASCSLNGGSYRSCWDYEYLPEHGALANGSGSTISVRATDPEGRTTTVMSTFDIAIPSPEVEISRPAPGEVIGSSTLNPEYTIDGEDGWDGDCRVDGGTWRYCESGYTTFTGLTNGAHTIEIRVYDAFNNPTITGPISFSVADAPGPDITIDSPTEGATLTTSEVYLEFGSSDAYGLSCWMDGEPFYCSTYGWYYEEFDLANGSHQFVATGTDYLGQTATVTRNFTVADSTPPTLAISSPTSGSVYSSNIVPLDFSTDSPGAQVQCKLNGVTKYCRDGYNLSILNGTHTLMVYLTDGAGNTSVASTTFTVDDQTPPEIQVLSPVEGFVYDSGSVPFSATAGDTPREYLQCSVDGGSWFGCAWTNTIQLSAGNHTLSVRVTDANGLTSTVVRSFSVGDVTPPIVTITSHQFTQNNSSIQYTVNEPTSRVTCLVDDVVVATTTLQGDYCFGAGHNFGWIGNGPHVITVIATDSAGNKSSATSSITVLIPSQPMVSIQSPSEGQTLTDSNLTLAFGLSTPLPEYNHEFAFAECRVDSRPWQFCSSYNFRPKALSNGPHTVSVRITDAEGRSGVASRGFVVSDTTPPTFAIGSPSEGAVVTGDYLWVSINSSSPASWHCRINDEALWKCPGGWWETDISHLEPGVHSVTVVASDPAGNTSNHVRNFVIPAVSSNSPMNLQITDPGPGSTVDSNFIVRYNSQRSLVHRLYGSVDGGQERRLKINATGWWIGPLHNGPHSVTLRAVDDTGNSQAASINVNVVDSSPPSVEITSPADGATVGVSPPRIRFAADSDIQLAECKVDARSFEPCNTAFAYRPKGLLNGSHTVVVRVTDMAGNFGQDSISFTLTDTTPPSFSVVTPIEGAAVSGSPVTRLALSIPNPDVYDDIECSVNGQPFPLSGRCDNGTRLTDLPYGPIELSVTLTDGVGNAFTVVRNFTNSTPVDTTAPLVSFKLPKNNSVFTDSSDTWTTWSAYDFDEFGHPVKNVSVQCRADGGEWSYCVEFYNSSTQSNMGRLPGGNGSHQFDLKATDSAGNVGSASLSYAVNDTTPPEVTIVSPADDSAVDQDAIRVEIETEKLGAWLCRIDSTDPGDFQFCQSSFTIGSGDDTLVGPGSGLDAGEHTLWVQAFDPAGNVNVTQSTFTVNENTLDTNFTAGPNGLTNDSTPEWTLATVPAELAVECRVDGGTWTAATGGSFVSSSLVDGDHAIYCRAVDGSDRDSTPAVRSITIDSLPPDTSFLSSPQALSNDASPFFSLGTSEGSITYECRLDLGEWTTRNSGFELVVEEGNHVVDCRARDQAGNIDPSPATASFEVDLTPPVTTFGQFSQLNNIQFPSIPYTRSEPGTTHCRIDDGSLVSVGASSWYNTGSVGDGDHQAECRSTDVAGNTGEFASLSFTTDRTSPVSEVLSPQPGEVTSSTVNFSFTAADAHLGQVTCRIDSQPFDPCTSPVTFSGLAEGPHTIRLQVPDMAGNLTAHTVSIIVDTVPPETTMTPSGQLRTNDTTPSFAIFSSEAGSSFECRMDEGSWTSRSAAWTSSTLSDGSYLVECRAIDAVGNVDATPAATELVVDTVPPAVTIEQPPAITNDPTPTVAVSADEDAVFQCAVNAGAFITTSSSFTPSWLTDGSHTLSCRARDLAGNLSSPSSVALVVDTTLPQIDFAAPIYGARVQSAPTVVHSEFDLHLDEVTCSLNGLSLSECSSPVQLAALVDGPYEFTVRATDTAGNTAESSVGFVVDTLPPDTSVNPAGATLTSDATPVAQLAASESASGFQCRVDGGEWSNSFSTTSFTSPELEDGEHEIDCRAIDLAGNIDPSPASKTWIVDTTAPTVTIDQPEADATTDDPTPEVSFTVSDIHDVRAECSLDGANFSSCVSPIALPELDDGQHTFAVKGIDEVANSHTVQRVFTVDAPDPISDAGDDIVVERGKPVLFGAGASRPTELFTAASWSFGDGAVANTIDATHAYMTIGEFEVTLTTRIGGRSHTDTATVQVVESTEPAISVSVTSGGGIVEGADVLLVLPDGTRIQDATDATGKAKLHGAPDGTYSLYVYAAGFRPTRETVTVSNGSATANVELLAGTVGTASIESERMTRDEIIDAGIDPDDPANSHIVKFQIGLAINGTDFNIGGYTSGTGSGGSGGGGGGGGGGSGGGDATATLTSTDCVPLSEDSADCNGSLIRIAANGDVLVLMVLEGKAKFLKEFFRVTMTVVNTSDEGFDFNAGSAKLTVPEGLALAPTLTQPNTAQMAMDPIEPGSSRSASWYLRGDEEGEYDLSARYSSTLAPFDSPIQIDATTAEPLKVWAGSALKMIVEADDDAGLHSPYRVRIGLENVADIPVYNASIGMNPAVHANFIYQPREIYDQSHDEIAPGETWWSDYTIVPRIQGDLESDYSYIAKLGGTTDFASTEIRSRPHDEPLDYKAYRFSDKVVLDWEPVPGVSEDQYEVFSTPEDDQPFSTTPKAVSYTAANGSQLSDDGTKVIVRTDSPDDYFAVSPMTSEGPRMRHPMLKGELGGGPSVSASGKCAAPGESTSVRLSFTEGVLGLDHFENLKVNGQTIGDGTGQLFGSSPSYSPTVESAGFGGNNVEVTAVDVDGEETHYSATVGHCRMVSLGDSFSSGEGIGDYRAGTESPDGNKCHQSDKAYPFKFVSRLDSLAPEFEEDDFLPCSGALIGDVMDGVGPGEADGKVGSEADRQIDRVSSPGAVDVLTLTIGGNDAGFGGTVQSCLLNLPGQPGCDLALHTSSLLTDAIAGFLPAAYLKLSQKFPNARIYVLGYPRIFPSSLSYLGNPPWSGTCLAIDPFEADGMRNAIDSFNAVIERSVVRANAENAAGRGRISFVTNDGFEGHDVCRSSGSWFTGVQLKWNWPNPIPESQESFHPNESGHDQMASNLAAFVTGTPGVDREVRGSTIIQLGQTIVRTFAVPSGLQSGRFSIAWPGSDVELKLISPTGQTFSGQGDASGAHTETETSESFTLTDPEAGTWTAEMTGVEVEPGGEPVDYRFDELPTVNLPPKAVPAIDPAGVELATGQVAIFTAEASSDPDGEIANYEWNFGDGSTSSGAVVSHSFTSPGTYYVSLTITDDGGSATTQTMPALAVTQTSTEPTGPTGPTDPTGPTGPIEPTAPTGPTEPTEPGGGTAPPHSGSTPAAQPKPSPFGQISISAKLKARKLAKSKALKIKIATLAVGARASAKLYDKKRLIGSSSTVRGTGGAVTVVVKLNRAGKKLLNSRKPPRGLSVRVQVDDGSGTISTTIRSIRLVK